MCTSHVATSIPDTASDYGDFGSDIEEIEILDQLLAQVDDGHDASFIVTDIEDYEPPRGILLPKDLVWTRLPASQDQATAGLKVLCELEAESVDKTRRASLPRDPTPPSETNGPDTRSPLDRFRKPPKKALSVTDLVSPAWCELQYFYTLSKHGRKKRTPAMKQGSKIHKSLEDEVHITVPIETTKVEDTWGLRFWNICQGLKTLRDTGRTRELEVWGMIGGELVNGVIDELSYECPDSKYEESLKTKGTPVADLPEYQTSITEYLLAKPDKDGSLAQKPQIRANEKWVYLTDVKTRATPTLPTGSSLRPTVVQLHLYHHMLENLIQGNFALERLTERYDLNLNETFSDSFLAELANLNQEVFSQSSQSSNGKQAQSDSTISFQDPMDVLLRHNTMATLWEYMMQQLRTTFLLEELPKTLPLDLQNPFPPPASQQSTSDLPPPPLQPTRLSPLLTASYMASTYKHTPSSSGTTRRVLGHKSFTFNPAFLHAYLTESLSWWRGQRDAKGVALQEAWKCRSCDFKGDCEWILQRDQMAFDEAMERKKMREMEGVEMPAVARSKV